MHSIRKVHQIPMERIYKRFKISRQGFKKSVDRFESERSLMKKIKPRVKSYRLNIDSRAGSRSLFYNLDIKSEFKLGINKFEHLMSKYSLSLIPLRTRVVTTKSSLQSWNYKNLCNGLVINGINQLIVGDITYISIGRFRYYLFCLTDVYSARIVGHHLSTRMRKQEALLALEMMVKLRKVKNLTGCRHHTDGGGQYFSGQYLDRLDGLKIAVSVARSCLENGYAEQKNGILKNHILPTMDISYKQSFEKEIARVINNYNKIRKQEALGWKSPNQFERYVSSLESKPKLKMHDHETNTKSKRTLGFGRHISTKSLNKKMSVQKSLDTQ